MAIAEIGSPAALDKARLLDMYAQMVLRSTRRLLRSSHADVYEVQG
jgi:hypothetical protein